MKARERIEKVSRILEARRAKRDVRGSLALARRKEAEGVEQRRHADKPGPAARRGPGEPRKLKGLNEPDEPHRTA